MEFQIVHAMINILQQLEQITNINFIISNMTTISGNSRLSNLRENKTSSIDANQDTQLKLNLPYQQKSTAYQPTSTFNNTRTSMRLLKGRIQKNKNQQESTVGSQTRILQSKLKLEQPESFKLVIHDSPDMQIKKQVIEQPKFMPQKRILIAKQVPKQQPIIVQKKVQQLPKIQQIQERPIKQLQKKSIQEEDVQQSRQPQNQNDLVECPQGCGRKFNRKALQKHAKACKIVFMSKRKQFNSQAKRVTSKQQANIVKQNKLKEKKELGKTKGKGFEKTGQNWKLASEQFRNALKSIKKEQKEQKQQNEQNVLNDNEDALGDNEKVQTVKCQYCEKIFNEIFMEKHLQSCTKKKEKEKKTIVKKKK